MRLLNQKFDEKNFGSIQKNLFFRLLDPIPREFLI